VEREKGVLGGSGAAAGPFAFLRRYNQNMRFASWRSGVLLLTFLLVLLTFLAAGCQKAPRKLGSLSMPTEGNVRIVSREIENTPTRLHWKWSIIGERNWRKAMVTDTAATLSDTYPLNDTTVRGGCNIWETDLTVADGHWSYVLHGSDGKTAKSEGTLSAGSTDLSKAVTIREDGDRLTSLTANLVLATVDGKSMTFRIER
jgi:hypothetical protein